MPFSPQPAGFLPDFCTGGRVLRVLVVCQAVATVLALGGSLGPDLPQRFLLLSVYLQWIGICSAAALCLIRQYAGHRSSRGVALLSYLVLLAVTFAITEVTFVAGRYSGFSLLLEHSSHIEFVSRNLGICAVVAALALRYFWLRADSQHRAEAEMRARLEALQARIEPHFLFNSLNSVAALIEVRPREAETALEDLAQLLRARLASDAPAQVSLADEMKLVQAYVRIERLRLQSRLQMTVDVADDAWSCKLPALCLQPLVENAIGHGIARLPDGGTVTVAAYTQGSRLHVHVSNPLAANMPSVPGNRQALVNIEHRLALRYGDDARMNVIQNDSRFMVAMQLPRDITTA